MALFHCDGVIHPIPSGSWLETFETNCESHVCSLIICAGELTVGSFDVSDVYCAFSSGGGGGGGSWGLDGRVDSASSSQSSSFSRSLKLIPSK